MPEVTFITTTQVAERFQVDPSTVRKWVDNGHLKPAIRTPGGHYRFRAEDVDAVMTVEVTQAPGSGGGEPSEPGTTPSSTR